MKKIIFICYFFIIFGLLFLNYQLRIVKFYDWDEAMYAQIAREMITNRSIWTTFNHQLWFDKPPLTHILLAINFVIFGENEFFARSLMVILGIILLILLFKLAKKLFNNDHSALISVLILAATPIFIERSTILNSDLLVAISWLGYFLYFSKYWKKLFFLTLGVLSKSVLGFYPLLFDFIYHLINYQKIKINLKNIIKLLFFIIPPSFWYILGYLFFGMKFIEDHFFSQMLKRLYVPIELHFGNKFFYFFALWKNLNFINLFIILGYLLLLINLNKEIKKNLIKLIILLSTLPFLALLTIMKTKIDWYVIIFLPLICLIVGYLYQKINHQLIKKIIFLTIFIFFLVNFAKQTYLLKTNNYQLPEKTQLAICLNKKNINRLAFFVEEQERKNRQFLEAAHYQTTSSFYYGGSPSFVFYLNKPVEFFYSFDKLADIKNNFSHLVIEKNDYRSIKNEFNGQIICQTNNWLSFKIDNGKNK